jgi:hypothetical protein
MVIEQLATLPVKSYFGTDELHAHLARLLGLGPDQPLLYFLNVVLLSDSLRSSDRSNVMARFCGTGTWFYVIHMIMRFCLQYACLCSNMQLAFLHYKLYGTCILLLQSHRHKSRSLYSASQQSHCELSIYRRPLLVPSQTNRRPL